MGRGSYNWRKETSVGANESSAEQRAASSGQAEDDPDSGHASSGCIDGVAFDPRHGARVGLIARQVDA